MLCICIITLRLLYCNKSYTLITNSTRLRLVRIYKHNTKGVMRQVIRVILLLLIAYYSLEQYAYIYRQHNTQCYAMYNKSSYSYYTVIRVILLLLIAQDYVLCVYIRRALVLFYQNNLKVILISTRLRLVRIYKKSTSALLLIIRDAEA